MTRVCGSCVQQRTERRAHRAQTCGMTTDALPMSPNTGQNRDCKREHHAGMNAAETDHRTPAADVALGAVSQTVAEWNAQWHETAMDSPCL